MARQYLPPLLSLTGGLDGQINPADEIPGHALSWSGDTHHITTAGFLDAPERIPAGSVRAIDFPAIEGAPAMRIATQTVRREALA